MSAGVTAPSIEVSALVKRYDTRTVVDGVSLDVHPGEVVALLGPNGAGKTTTVEIIEGYRRADVGTVRVAGEDPAGAGRDLRARVGLMLQTGGFDLRARPRETIEQYARFHANPRDPAELVALLGLDEVARTPYRRLSGGERQRLALAVALVGRPDVLILDEPTAGMDPEGRASIRAIIGDLRSGGAAILMTSHELVDVERVADRIVVLIAGRVAASGTPAELASTLERRLRFRVDRALSDAERMDLERAVGAAVATDGDGYAVAGPSDPSIVAAFTTWCARRNLSIVELRTAGGSLEDAYLDLVARRSSERDGR